MKINAGQAPSTLIPEYIGSAFDKIITVADNIEHIAEIANSIKGSTVNGYIGDIPPTEPMAGTTWYCTLDGRSYIWYEDTDSGQWVEASPQGITDDPKLAGNIFTLWKRSAAAAGYTLVAGSFEEGGVLTSPTDVLWHKGLDSIYSWEGTYPHVVPPNTNPIGNTSYVPHTESVSPTHAETELAKESLRRTYADAGLTVKGYTKDGATLASTSDVIVHNISGKGYSWNGAYPAGGYVVNPETDPTLNVNFVDRSPLLLRRQLASIDSAKLIGGAYYQDIRAYSGDATVIECFGRTSTYKPGFGRFYRDDLDTVTLDDGGCVLVDALGRRWKRDLTGTDEVLVEWYGECIQNTDISLFAASAIDYALKNAIPYVTLPCTKMGESAFLWENNITKDLGVAGTFDLTVRGHGVGHSVTRIRHTNTALGYGLTLQRTSTGIPNIFAVAALKNVWITGNTSSKGFIRFADTFGVRVEKVFGTGYGLSTATDKGSLVTLANLKYWTEGAVLIDVHSRDNFALIKFERNSATGGTSSFFGLVMKRCWHRFNSIGGGAIFIKGYTAENNVVVYGAMIEIGGWFEVGTDNALILTGDYGSIVASTVNAIPDGFGGNLNGEAVRICKQTGMSSIDITLKNLGQGIPFSLDGFATGDPVYSFGAVGVQETPSALNQDGYPAPLLRMRGGSITWVANPTTDKRLKIAYLPSYSSLHVKFAVIGSNKTISDEYLVTTFGRNEVADVKLLAGGTPDPHFFARTYSGLAAKTVSDANGRVFEIIMNAATAAGTGYKLKMEVTIM